MKTETRLEEKHLRHCFAAHPSGVTAVCGLLEDRTPTGMVVSTFTPVSLDPPLASICIRRNSTTWPQLFRLPKLGVSILGAIQERHCRDLATRPIQHRFTDIPWKTTTDGAVLIVGAVAAFECTVAEAITAGDHVIAVLELHEARLGTDHEPLVFCHSSYQRLDPDRGAIPMG